MDRRVSNGRLKNMLQIVTFLPAHLKIRFLRAQGEKLLEKNGQETIHKNGQALNDSVILLIIFQKI